MNEINLENELIVAERELRKADERIKDLNSQLTAQRKLIEAAERLYSFGMMIWNASLELDKAQIRGIAEQLNHFKDELDKFQALRGEEVR